VFPGPIFFSEVYIFERALAWGIIQTTVVYALRRLTVLGPVHIIVAGLILIFRERKRREMKQSVTNDMSLFGVAWKAIQEEVGVAEATARLVKFEMEMQNRLGSRHLKLGPRHATDRAGPGPWEASDLTLSQSLRSVLDLTLWPVSGTDLEAGNSAAAGGRGYRRGKLLIERRSPFLSRLLQAPEPLSSLDQLYAQATMLDPIFRTRVQRLAGMCRGHFYVPSDIVGGRPELRAWSEIQEDPAARCRVRWPDIKHVDQALRKGILYNGNILRLVDLVRQRIIFTRLSDICECLDAIDNDPDLQILRVKNRFDPNIDAHWTAGYRDVVLVLRVVTPVTTMLGISGHCCELQLAHQDMANLITPSQHSRYLRYRSVMAFGQSSRHVDDGFLCRVGTGRHVLQPSPSRSRGQIVPAEQTRGDGRETSGMANKVADSSVPWPIVRALRQEQISTEIDDLAAGPAGSDLQALLTERVFEVLRARCHVRGNKLESMLQELRQAVVLADASMVLFARPLAALFKPVIQVVIFLFSMCCLYWYYSYGDWYHAYIVSRHARFTVHEVRSGAGPQAGVAHETGISKLSLLRDGCSLRPAGARSDVNESSIIVTLPQLTEFNGWAMTTSHFAGSEGSDPVRFDFSYAEIDTTKHTFEECLKASAWRTQAEVQGQSPAERRAEVVEELVAQHGAWCMAGNLKRCEDLSDAELLRLCIPAPSILEEEWRMVSASACRWASSSIACIPRPSELFDYRTLERGATHAFDLRPPWYVITGVVVIYLPIMVSALLCVLLGYMGNLVWTRVTFGLCFLIPGIIELITAGGLAFAGRVNHSAPHFANRIDPRDSFYWWPLSFTTIVVGATILISEKTVLTTFPIYFGINFTALLIHNCEMIGQLPVEFPFSSGFLLFFWAVFKLLRFYVLRESYKSIAPDSECYDAEWKRVMQSMDNAAAIRDLDDVAERISTSKDRPQQALPSSLRALESGVGVGGATPTDLCGPAFLPSQFQSSRMRLLRVEPWRRPTLDTLYMQACVLEPIFNLKIQQLAASCDGMFLVRDATHADGSSIVSALEWEPMGGLKSVDRSIEKLTRSYQGHVPSLLDIVRQCVVFENLQDMLRMCRILEGDGDVQVVRVKNRMAENYNARISAGYRDILVNLRLKSDHVRKLGLDLHVCELQLILKQFMMHKSLEGHRRYVEFRNKRCE
jgi:ppGpp synthetase/RelA/SpoT-type nucleotidyltranferase